MIAYPFVIKEDGYEGYDYVATQVSNMRIPGPPYECANRTIPPDMFKRLGYESFDSLLKPMMDNPDSFTRDLTEGISAYHGGLLLISSECSILGSAFQDKFNISGLPVQTVHVKTANMGHNLLTEDSAWSLQTIGKFFRP